MWYVGEGLFKGVVKYMGGSFCGALGARDNWSNRRWGLVSLVQEIESLTPKVVGVASQLFVNGIGYDVFVEPIFLL